MAKKNYGIQPKKRTLEEINQDYNNAAAQFGHKSRIRYQIECELEDHLITMKSLNEEASLLQKDIEKEVPEEAVKKEEEQAQVSNE